MGAAAKRMGFVWGPAQEKALAALKEACQIAPALGAPDYDKPIGRLPQPVLSPGFFLKINWHWS
jgi:hypothetical protein